METSWVCMRPRGHVFWQLCLCACSETKKKAGGVGVCVLKKQSLLKGERAVGRGEEDDLALGFHCAGSDP